MTQSPLLSAAINIAREAAEVIFGIYQDGVFESQTKSDHTPVTSADLAAHQHIMARLSALTPDIPIISEEGKNIPLSDRTHWSRYWLIDPLDGTQEFIAKSGEFATIIALIEDNQPVLGVVCQPGSGTVYYAERGQGAFRQDQDGKIIPLAVKRHDEARLESITIAVSRRQDSETIRAYLCKETHYTLVPLGSATLKACLVAEGGADCYLRIGPTGEWDTGATQCIVEEAGGRISDLSLDPLTYNQRESLENPNFIVCGDLNLPWQQLLTP